MKTRFLPIAGAILNMFFFGLPDILVGRILKGLLKLSCEFLLFPFCMGVIYGTLLDADASEWSSAFFLWSITLGYFVLAAIDGYKAFRSALENLGSNDTF